VAESRAERIALAIADGQPVDWRRERSQAATEELPLLEQLRVLGAVAAAARGPGPGDSWGPLELIAPLGSGAYADVFRARDTRLQRDVALKLLREPDAGGEVVAEGRMLARVKHPGVVTVHGADRIDGRTGIWMELVEGRTLDAELREQGWMDVTKAALLGADLAAALAAVHAAGLVHRDVKPHNVMRETSGRVVLMDFGVGRPLHGPPARPAGTPLYMAPELLEGGQATPCSDLYSLGVLLFHAVSGRYPVEATSLETMAEAHARGARVGLREAGAHLPEAFVRAVERALEPDPRQRFRSANEMEQALLEAVSPASTRGTSWRRIAAAALVVGLLLVIPWPHDHPERPDPTPTLGTEATPAPPAEPRSPPPRAGRPADDPFVAPVGGAAPADSTPPGSDAAYSIDARLDGGVQLRIRPSAPVSLYVFALDDSDRPSLVFPARGRLTDNPIAPGVETKVPVWGRRLVAVATPSRLAEFEAALARQRVPVADMTTLPISDAALQRLAAALGFAPNASGRLLAAAQPVAGHVEMLRGIWVRKLR
jgi:serine/threonine protein kinase